MKLTKSESTTVKPAANSRGLFRRQSTKSSLLGGTTASSNTQESPTNVTSKPSSNAVNGLPDFENPLEASPTIAPTTSRRLVRDRLPPRKPKRVLSKRLEDRKTTVEKRSQPDLVPAAPPPAQKAFECIEELQNVPNFPENNHFQNEVQKSFENMIIECDEDSSTTGELTYDGSTMYEEGYWGNQQQNYRRRPDSFSQQPRVVPTRDAAAAVASPSRTRNQHNNNSFNSDRHSSTSDNNMRTNLNRRSSIEEEEKLLIELAMERSLQDSQSGASMSMSDSHMSSVSGRGSYRSRASSGAMSTSSNLGSAGCHLAMLAGSGAGGGSHHTHSPLDGQGSDSSRAPANNFIWKREGKKWIKIPIHGNYHHQHPGVSCGAGDLCLQAIKEVEKEIDDSLHQSWQKTKYIQPEVEEEGFDSFDLHHQNYVEDVMHRSLTAQLNCSSGNWSSAGGSFADDDEEHDRQAILARRLQELERERALIECTMLQETEPLRWQLSLDRRAPVQPRRQVSLDRQAPVPPRRQQSVNQFSEPRPTQWQPLDQQQSLDRRPSSDRRSSFQARPRPVSCNSADMTLCSQSSMDRRSPSSNSHVSGSGGESLSAAGCHLAMIATAARHSGGGGGGCGSSTFSSNTTNEQKLVWKRGPNNAWGRFPEHDHHCEQQEEVDNRIHNREEAMVAEALKRSLNEM